MNNFSKISQLSVLGLLETLITPVFTVILTGLVSKSLGAEGFGYWVWFTVVLSFFNIFTSGLSDWILRLSNTDDEKLLVSRNLVGLLSFNLIITTSVIFVYSYVGNLSIFWVALSFATISRPFEFVTIAWLKSKKQFVDSVKVSVISRASFFVPQVILVNLGSDINQVLLFGSFLNLGIILCIGLKFYDLLRSNVINSLISFIRLTYHSRAVFALAITSFFGANVDKIFIQKQLDVTSLGVYAAGFAVLASIHMIISQSTTWLVVYTAQQEEGEMLMPLTFCLILFGFFVSYSLSAAPGVFVYWLGQDVYEKSAETIDVFCKAIPVYVCTIVPYQVLKGRGSFKVLTFIDILNSVLRLMLMYLLWPIGGSVGVAWAVLLSGLFLTLSYLFMLRCYFSRTYLILVGGFVCVHFTLLSTEF